MSKYLSNDAAALKGDSTDHVDTSEISAVLILNAPPSKLPQNPLTTAQVNKREEDAQKYLNECCVAMTSIKEVLSNLERGRSHHMKALYIALIDPYVVYIQIKGNCDAEAEVVKAYWKLFPASKERCTVHLIQMLIELRLGDCGDQADRYARALRYALFKQTLPNDLKPFLEASGGITGCVNAHRDLTRNPEDQRGATSKPKTATVVFEPGVRDVIANLDLPLNTEASHTFVLRRVSAERVVVTAMVTTPQ